MSSNPETFPELVAETGNESQEMSIDCGSTGCFFYELCRRYSGDEQSAVVGGLRLLHAEVGAALEAAGIKSSESGCPYNTRLPLGAITDLHIQATSSSPVHPMVSDALAAMPPGGNR